MMPLSRPIIQWLRTLAKAISEESTQQCPGGLSPGIDGGLSTERKKTIKSGQAESKSRVSGRFAASPKRFSAHELHQARATGVSILSNCSRYAFLRRTKERPSKPMPQTLSEAGSGTTPEEGGWTVSWAASIAPKPELKKLVALYVPGFKSS